MVPGARIELAHGYPYQILSLARLPVPPPRQRISLRNMRQPASFHAAAPSERGASIDNRYAKNYQAFECWIVGVENSPPKANDLLPFAGAA